jgi:hypothetical protein
MRFGSTQLLLILAGGSAIGFTGCAKPAPDPAVPAPVAKVKPGTTLSANPNPVYTKEGPLGITSLSWITTAVHTEMHVDSPSGPVLGNGGSTGTFKTGLWVKDGMTFFLQNSDAPAPTDASATLGSVAIAVHDSIE